MQLTRRNFGVDAVGVALRSKFYAPAFHDAVLGGGSLPLSLLDARIDRWIAERRVA